MDLLFSLRLKTVLFTVITLIIEPQINREPRASGYKLSKARDDSMATPNNVARSMTNDVARRHDEHGIAICDLDLPISRRHLSFDINSTSSFEFRYSASMALQEPFFAWRRPIGW